MSDKKIITVAEFEHLHNRINVLLGLVDLTLSLIHDDSTPEQQQMIISQMRASGQKLEQVNMQYNVARMEGRGFHTVVQEMIGKPVEKVKFVEEPATAGQIIDWNRLLIANGNGLIYSQAHEDSPFMKSLSSQSLEQLGNVAYEDTASGIYMSQKGDMTALMTILRIEKEGELRHFAMIPYGAGMVEFRTYLKDEGIWISHNDTRVVTIGDVRQSIFDMLNVGFTEMPPPVDAEAAYKALINAMEDRKPGEFVKGVELVYDEGVLKALHHSTENHALSLYVDHIDDKPAYRIEFNGTFVNWDALHPLIQQQLIRDFATDLFSNEAERLQSVEQIEQAVAANDDN